MQLKTILFTLLILLIGCKSEDKKIENITSKSSNLTGPKELKEHVYFTANYKKYALTDGQHWIQDDSLEVRTHDFTKSVNIERKNDSYKMIFEEVKKGRDKDRIEIKVKPIEIFLVNKLARHHDGKYTFPNGDVWRDASGGTRSSNVYDHDGPVTIYILEGKYMMGSVEIEYLENHYEARIREFKEKEALEAQSQ